MTMHIGHVALRVTDLPAAVEHVRRVLGLDEVARSDSEALVTSNAKHHELQLLAGPAAGLDHVGLEVESEPELDEVVDRAISAGARVLPGDHDERGLGRAVRFVGAGDIVYEVYDGMERKPLTLDVHLKPLTRKLG